MLMENYREPERNDRRESGKHSTVDGTTRYGKASGKKKKECRCTKVNNKWIIK